MRGCVGVEEKSTLSRAGDKVVEQSVRETSDEADAGGKGAVWGLPVVSEDWIIPAEGLRPKVSECDQTDNGSRIPRGESLRCGCIGFNDTILMICFEVRDL